MKKTTAVIGIVMTLFTLIFVIAVLVLWAVKGTETFQTAAAVVIILHILLGRTEKIIDKYDEENKE